jgi:hypothetical protein
MLVKSAFVGALCLAFVGNTMTAHAATHRSFALVLVFSTCVTDPTNATSSLVRSLIPQVSLSVKSESRFKT